jgi:hypothetical protein
MFSVMPDPILVGEPVAHQPGGDVVEVLRRVLQPVDVGHPVGHGGAGPGLGRQQPGEGGVQPHVVAVEGVRAETDRVDADQVQAVPEVVHHRGDRVPRVVVGDGGVRRGRHADHPAGVGDRTQHVVALEPRDVPDRAGTGVGQEDRRLGRRAGVDAGPVGGVRDVDGQPELVHPPDGAPAERGEPAVDDLVEPGAQRVGVGVGDADLPDAQAEQDVELVQVVADRGGRLQPEHQPDATGGVGGLDVGDRPDDADAVLVGEVREPHAEVDYDVVPLPRCVAGDAGGAVHHVVEHDGEPGVAQPGEGGVLAAGAVVARGVGYVGGEQHRVVVQADRHVVRQ